MLDVSKCIAEPAWMCATSGAHNFSVLSPSNVWPKYHPHPFSSIFPIYILRFFFVANVRGLRSHWQTGPWSMWLCCFYRRRHRRSWHRFHLQKVTSLQSAMADEKFARDRNLWSNMRSFAALFHPGALRTPIHTCATPSRHIIMDYYLFSFLFTIFSQIEIEKEEEEKRIYYYYSCHNRITHTHTHI